MSRTERAEPGSRLAGPLPARGEHPVHQALDVGLGDALQGPLPQPLTDRLECVPVLDLVDSRRSGWHRRGIRPGTDSASSPTAGHRCPRPAGAGYGTARPVRPLLVKGAGELLSLSAVVFADIHDEPVPDRPVRERDLANQLFHVVSLRCAGWSGLSFASKFDALLLCPVMHRKSRHLTGCVSRSPLRCCRSQIGSRLPRRERGKCRTSPTTMPRCSRCSTCSGDGGHCGSSGSCGRLG